MKRIAPFLFLLFISVSHAQEEHVIVWKEDRKLSWQDFTVDRDANSPFAASTTSGISFSYTAEFTDGKPVLNTKVQAYFYPELSWYKPQKVNEVILRHEQGHFDISEIHARKLRKVISEASFDRNLKREISALYKKTEKERELMQNRFDKETNHSRNIEKEKQWQEFIAKELERLKAWKN